MRHLISRPTGVASDSAKGLLPSLVLIEDGDGDMTRVRLLPSPAFGVTGSGVSELHTDAGIDGDHPAGRRHERVEVELGDLRMRVRERGHAPQDVADAFLGGTGVRDEARHDRRPASA